MASGSVSISLYSLNIVGPLGSLTTNGWSYFDGTPLVSGPNSTPGQYYLIDHSAIAASISFEVDLISPSISLNSGPAIEWAALPSGIIFSNLVFDWFGQMSAIGATSHFVVTCGSYSSGNLNAGPYGPLFNLPIDSGLSYSPLQVLNLVAEIVLVSSGNAVIATPTQVFEYGGIGLNGTYTTVNFQATLTPANSLTNIGDIITISSSGSSAINLSHISSLNIGYFSPSGTLTIVNIPASSFISQSQFSITFSMINFGTAYQVIIDAVGDGTQFSGSVTLGSMPTINFTDGSGIYVLTPGQTSDILYAQGSNPIQTVQVAIPNPFIKTAFIP